MFCKTCLLGLGVQLYIAILCSSGIATKLDGDYIVYDEKHPFDVALKILAEIRENPCPPCFTQTTAWPGPSVSFPFQNSQTEKVFCNQDCHFMGNCHKFGKKICYSWNIAVIVGGKKYIIFSTIPENTEGKNYLNITCYDTANFPQSEDMNGKQSKYNGSVVIQTNGLDTDNKRNTHSNGWSKQNKMDQNSQTNLPQNKDFSGKQPSCNESTAKSAIDLEMDSKRDVHSNNRDNQKMDQASQGQYGLLLLTHLIAAVIGCGIICLVLFVKKSRQSRPKSKKKAGILNASYGRQESKPAITTDSNLFYGEAVYHEVSDGMQTVSLENSSSTRQTFSDFPKQSKLPDIPQLPEKDAYHCLTSQHRKEVEESEDDNYDHAHLHALDMTENDNSLDDKNVREESRTLDISINSSKEAFCEESNNEYFVLQKEPK